MLLFQKEHIDLIKAGLKTQTRRLWKKPRAKEGSVHKMKLKMLSKEDYGKIKIFIVIKQRLLDITESESQKEGGYTREEYLKLWFRINPKSPPNPEVYVVEFRYLKETD